MNCQMLGLMHLGNDSRITEANRTSLGTKRTWMSLVMDKTTRTRDSLLGFACRTRITWENWVRIRRTTVIWVGISRNCYKFVCFKNQKNVVDLLALNIQHLQSRLGFQQQYQLQNHGE